MGWRMQPLGGTTGHGAQDEVIDLDDFADVVRTDEGSHGVSLVLKERPFIRTVLHNPVQCWSQYLGSSHSRVIHPLVLNVPVVKSRSIVRNEKLISIRVRARTLLGIFAPANIPDGKSFKTWVNNT